MGSQEVPRGFPGGGPHDQRANWQQLFVGFAGLPLFYFQFAAVKNKISTFVHLVISPVHMQLLPCYKIYKGRGGLKLDGKPKKAIDGKFSTKLPFHLSTALTNDH